MHKSFLSKENITVHLPFLKWKKSECLYEELLNLYNSCKFKNNSATEYILIMEWYINNYSK